MTKCPQNMILSNGNIIKTIMGINLQHELSCEVERVHGNQRHNYCTHERQKTLILNKCSCCSRFEAALVQISM